MSKSDTNEIIVKINKYNAVKDDEYRFLSPDEATLDIITELLCHAESDFVAVDQDAFSQNECHFLFHVPRGADKDRFDIHTKKAKKFESVDVYNQKYSIQLTEIENRDTDNRLVLYDEAEQNLRDGDYVESGGEFHE